MACAREFANFYPPLASVHRLILVWLLFDVGCGLWGGCFGLFGQKNVSWEGTTELQLSPTCLGLCFVFRRVLDGRGLAGKVLRRLSGSACSE
jgi:hypothetical protein